MVFYDLTTIRAAGLSEQPSELRRFGLAKEGTHCAAMPAQRGANSANRQEAANRAPGVGRQRAETSTLASAIVAVPGRRYAECVEVLADVQPLCAAASTEVVGEVPWSPAKAKDSVLKRLMWAHDQPIQHAFGNIAYSMAVSRGLLGAMKRLVRGEITGYTDIFNTIRHKALERLVAQARREGANAVVGADAPVSGRPRAVRKAANQNSDSPFGDAPNLLSRRPSVVAIETRRGLETTIQRVAGRKSKGSSKVSARPTMGTENIRHTPGLCQTRCARDSRSGSATAREKATGFRNTVHHGGVKQSAWKTPAPAIDSLLNPRTQTAMSSMHPTSPPFVFVSYSHDSEEHIQQVLSFLRQLRADGVDAHCDREVIAPAQGWLRWMNENIRRADYVLAVCTPIYAGRAEGRAPHDTGLGANFEGAIIGQALYEAGMTSNKFHPIGFGPLTRPAVPFFFQGRSTFDVKAPAGYRALYQVLTNQRPDETGKLGPIKELSKVAVPQLRDVWADDPMAPESAFGPAKALVGVAIDLSGSMKESMPRDLGETSTRMQAVRGALEKAGQRARQIAAKLPDSERDNVRLFAYGFGFTLQQFAVCDLLTLVKAAHASTTSEEIAAAKLEVEREARALAQNHSSLINLAERYFGQKTFSSIGQELVEDAVRKRILDATLARMQSMGTTTLSLAEFGDLWSGSADAFAQAEKRHFRQHAAQGHVSGIDLSVRGGGETHPRGRIKGSLRAVRWSADRRRSSPSRRATIQ